MRRYDLKSKLIEKAKRSRFWLWLLNLILSRIIPFNWPHRLRILKITDDSIEIKIPYRRSNLNHLKGLHACILAAASEYAMGLFLMSQLDPDRYRLIIQSLQVSYHFQGQRDSIVRFSLQRDWLEQEVVTPLKRMEAVVVSTEAKVFDTQGNHLCTGRVDWQIKHRDRIKTPL